MRAGKHHRPTGASRVYSIGSWSAVLLLTTSSAKSSPKKEAGQTRTNQIFMFDYNGIEQRVNVHAN